MDQLHPENSLTLTRNPDMIDAQPLLQSQLTSRQGASISRKVTGWIESFQDKFKPGSMTSSMFTLIMATFGTGILVLPASIAESGLIWAIIQLIVCAWLGYYSLMTVVICATKANVCSYQELAEKVYGKWFRWLVNVVMFFGNLGTVVLYLKMMASLMLNFILSFDHLTSWLDSDQTAMKITTAIMTVVFILPISLIKQLNNIRYICLISFFFVIFLCCVVFFEEFFFEPPPGDSKGVLEFEFGGVSTTFPTAVFAFMCHSNVLDVYGELTNASERRMRKVVGRTMITILICSTIVGVLGYITFADNLDLFRLPDVGGVVLYAYAYDVNGQFTPPPTPIRICLIMMSLALIVATPINVIPAKDAIKEVFFPKRCDKYGIPYDDDSALSHFLFVTSTVICAAALAIFPQASIQNLINAIASSLYTLICFIFPMIFHLKLYETSSINNKRKILNWTILVVMTGVGIWMTEANIAQLVSDK